MRANSCSSQKADGEFGGGPEPLLFRYTYTIAFPSPVGLAAGGGSPLGAIRATIAAITLSLTPPAFRAIRPSGSVEYPAGCALMVVTITWSPNPPFTILMMDSLLSAVCATASAPPAKH